jgi:TonB family protein
MIVRAVLLVILTLFLACAARREAPLPEPFSQTVATVPDSVDRFLMNLEFWRTRFGLSDCMSDTSRDDPATRVSLVTLDLYVSPYGSVDSIVATSARTTPPMLDCVRQVVRTWWLGEYPRARRYRFTLPMSPRLASLETGGPIEASTPADRRVSSGVMFMLYRSGAALAECYMAAEQPVGSLAESRELGGTVVVRFTAEPNGGVSDVRVVESTASAVGIDSCLVETVSRWRLPEGSTGTFEYPVSFAPDRARTGVPSASSAGSSGAPSGESSAGSEN